MNSSTTPSDLGRRRTRVSSRVRALAALAALAVIAIVAGVIAFGSPTKPPPPPVAASTLAATPLVEQTTAPQGSTSLADASPSVTTSASAASPYPTYPDGIPSEIGGMTVYRPSSLPAMSDATPFLIGGWSVTYEGETCPSLLATSSSALEGCLQGYAINDRQDLTGAVIWPLITLTNVTLPAVMRVPLVVRVHTHDSLAANCSVEARTGCQARIVLDAVVWTGRTS